MKQLLFITTILLIAKNVLSQSYSGNVIHYDQTPVANAYVNIKNSDIIALTDSSGYFQISETGISNTYNNSIKNGFSISGNKLRYYAKRSNEKLNMEVYNTQGRVCIRFTSLSKNSGINTVDISNANTIADGFYLINIEVGNRSYQTKLLKNDSQLKIYNKINVKSHVLSRNRNRDIENDTIIISKEGYFSKTIIPEDSIIGIIKLTKKNAPQPVGTILHTKSFLVCAEGSPLVPSNSVALTDLYNQNGVSLGINIGDTLFISGIDNNAQSSEFKTSFIVESNSTIQEFTDGMMTYLQSGAVIGGGGSQLGISATGSLGLDLSSIPLNAFSVSQLKVSSSNTNNDSLIQEVLNWGDYVASPGSGGIAIPYLTNGELREAASENYLIVDIFTDSGYTPQLEDDDVIGITGKVGGVDITPGTLVFNSSTTTLDALCSMIQKAFNLPDTDSSYKDNPTVYINTDYDNELPFGSIVIRGLPGKENSITEVQIYATNSDNDKITPERFNSNCIFTESQSASNSVEER